MGRSAGEPARALPERLLNRRAVADLFGISRETLRVWEKRGLLPTPLRMGRRAYWDPRVIVALLEDGRQ
jgi:predicted DNA-binding transcriptional regulator AlpA